MALPQRRRRGSYVGRPVSQNVPAVNTNGCLTSIPGRLHIRRKSEAKYLHAEFSGDVMSKTIILAVLLTALCIRTQCAQAQAVAAPVLASANWSATSAQPLTASTPSSAAVQALVNYLRQADGGGFSVCASRFANLRNSGTLSLVATVNQGTGFCNYIDIVDKSSSGFAIDEIVGSRGSGENLSQVVQDLNGDGIFELIVDTDFTNYEGASHCVASWPVIYGWTGSSYADVSAQFKSYYQQQLQTLQQEASPTPDDADYAECQAAETAKIERFLGLNPVAGLDDAIKWAGSTNPAERQFALPILRDIGTPEALADIQTLSHDSSPVVSAMAKLTLAGIAAGPQTNTPQPVTVSATAVSAASTSTTHASNP